MLHECSILKVFEVFTREPTKRHGLRELSRKTGLAQTSVKLWLEKLLEEGLILTRGEGRNKRYVADRENEDFLRLKQFFNLYRLHSSGLVDYVSGSYPKAVVLFGSFRYGTDVEKSDIDLLVLSDRELEFDFGEFPAELGREVSVLRVSSLSELEMPLLENVVNGIVLSGALEVKGLGKGQESS